jgi:hypothetical protein
MSHSSIDQAQKWTADFVKVVDKEAGSFGNGIEENLILRHDADFLNLASCDRNSVEELELLRAHFAPLSILNQGTNSP